MYATDTRTNAVLRQLDDIAALTEAELPAEISLAVLAQTTAQVGVRRQALAALYTSATVERLDYLSELIDLAMRDVE